MLGLLPVSHGTATLHQVRTCEKSDSPVVLTMQGCQWLFEYSILLYVHCYNIMYIVICILLYVESIGALFTVENTGKAEQGHKLNRVTNC